MYDYRSRLTHTIITVPQLRDKFARFQSAFDDALAEDGHDDGIDIDSWATDVSHGAYNLELLLGGSHSSLRAILDRLDESYASVDSGYADFADLYGELDEWDTLAAEDFRLQFMAKFADVNLGQLEAIKELIGLTSAFLELIARTRADLDALLDSAIEACQNYEPADGASGWNTFWKVAGVTAGVAGAVALGLPTGGASLVGGSATVVGAMAGIGGELSDGGDQQTREFEEATLIGVDFMYGVRALQERMIEEANALAGLIQADVDLLGDGSALQVNRPRVADVPDDQLVAQFPYYGSDSTMSVNLYQLWRAGTLRLPSVAVEYADSATSINTTRTTRAAALSGVEFIHGGFVERWSGLFDVVQDKLAQARDDLVDTGATLVSIAEEYSKTDDGNAVLIHDSAANLQEDLMLQIAQSQQNGNLDDVPSYVPQAPTSDSTLPSPEDERRFPRY